MSNSDDIQNKFDEKKQMKYRADDDTGYILEVDWDSPREMHDLHKDYPMICCLMPKRD